MLRGQPPGTLLDVATGSGYGAYMLAKYLPRFTVIGGDYNPRAIEHARRTYQDGTVPNLSYYGFDVVDWRVLDGDRALAKADYIVSFDTIEHLLHREIALVNFAESLTPEGMLLLSIPCGSEENLLNAAREHHKIEYSYRYLCN